MIFNVLTNIIVRWSPDRFDMDLKNFGVDTAKLQVVSEKRIFHAWIEDWEEPLLKKNDVIAEIRLLEKYKDLVFYDPGNECIYTVWARNLE